MGAQAHSLVASSTRKLGGHTLVNRIEWEIANGRPQNHRTTIFVLASFGKNLQRHDGMVRGTVYSPTERLDLRSGVYRSPQFIIASITSQHPALDEIVG
jgi:hypothetical protein